MPLGRYLSRNWRAPSNCDRRALSWSKLAEPPRVSLRPRRRSPATPSPSAQPKKPLQPMDVVEPILDVGVAHQCLEQGNCRIDAVDDEFIERAAKLHQRLVAVAPMHDELADERIVVWRNRVPSIDRAIDAHAKAAWRMVIGDLARRGPEGCGMLGIDPAFDRMPLKDNFLLGQRQGGARGNSYLLVDEIDPGDHFGYRMLDLNPCIHFDEIKFAIFVEKLDGAGAGITEFAHRACTNFADFQALRRIEGGGGAFLPDFLIPALQRAIAFAEMNSLAVAIAENLDFDMTRLFEKLFEIDRVVAEDRLSLDPRRFERDGKIVRGAGDFHAASAATRRRLYEDWKSKPPGDGRRLLIAGDRAGRARHAGDAVPGRRRSGLDLIAHEPDVRRLGADENDVMVGEDLREPRVLGEKSIARMQGFGAGDFASPEKRGDVEIGITRGGRPDTYRFVGEFHVHRMGVGRRMNRHCRDAELLGRAQYP